MPSWKDLKKNPGLWRNLILRSEIISAVREFFSKKGFLEVNTPLLLPAVIPESYLDVFSTYLKNRRGIKKRMFLAASPEASIKKMLVSINRNCFEITKSFRNGETDSNLHNPEFTILEWYRLKADYKKIISDCQDLILHIYNKISEKFPDQPNFKHSFPPVIRYRNSSINLSAPWKKISIKKALEKYSGISFADITGGQDSADPFTPDRITAFARKKGYSFSLNTTWEQLFNQIYLNEIEPNLVKYGKPVIIYDFPKPLAALAKVKKGDNRLVERFEFYIGGIELGDCYTELTDFREQKNRFEKNIREIKKYNKTAIYPDQELLECLKTGLPECAGIAVGLDRLVMLFADLADIKDTIFYG